VAWPARIIAAAVARALEVKDITVRLHMEVPVEEVEEAVVAE
jgi:adenine/guanine phosphoribosyltransferase-like PRPP-binding protein